MEPNESLTITPRVIYQEVNMDGWNRQDAPAPIAAKAVASRT